MNLTDNAEQKKPDAKEFTWHDSIYIKFLNGQMESLEIDHPWREGLTVSGHKGNFEEGW